MQENEIQAIVAGQRQFFFGGKTLPLDYRIQALKRLKQAIVGNQKKIADALQQDLGKSEAEGFMVRNRSGAQRNQLYAAAYPPICPGENGVYAAFAVCRGQPHPADTLRCHVDYESLELSLPAYGRTTGGCAGGRQYRCGQAECLFAGDKCCGGRAPFIGFSARICGGGDRRAGGKPVPC